LGPIGTAATNGPFVPAPGDYEDGEIGGIMIGRGKQKPAPVPLSSPQTPHTCPDPNPHRCGGKPATNRLSYGTALSLKKFQALSMLLHVRIFRCVQRDLDYTDFGSHQACLLKIDYSIILRITVLFLWFLGVG
jgi:hypothetical protein